MKIRIRYIIIVIVVIIAFVLLVTTLKNAENRQSEILNYLKNIPVENIQSMELVYRNDYYYNKSFSINKYLDQFPEALHSLSVLNLNHPSDSFDFDVKLIPNKYPFNMSVTYAEMGGKMIAFLTVVDTSGNSSQHYFFFSSDKLTEWCQLIQND